MNKSVKLLSFALLTVLLTLATVCYAVPSAIGITDSDMQTETVSLMTEETQALSGDGTEESPYLISDADEFLLLAEYVNSGNGDDAHYALTCDIDLGGAVLTPAGTKNVPFSGHFDGNGYTIKNFVISGSEYCGIFGYALNASIKNFYLDGISVVMTQADSSVTTSYAGSAVAYAVCKSGESLISGICVNETEILVNGLLKYIYAGSVAGCVNSGTGGVMRVENCYSRCAISVENPNGYAYAGGLVGKISTEFRGDTRMMYCYNVGAVSAKSANSSHAGGLAGYIWSYGSSYSPEVNLSGEAELMSDDTDILISNCFAAASLYSNSTKYSSRAGKITGSLNAYAECEKATTLYTNDESVSVTTGETYVVGTVSALDNFKNEEYLSSKLGFDFTNVWEIDVDGTYKFPVFKDVEYTYDDTEELALLEVTTDISLYAGNNSVNISDVSFVNGNSLYLDRGTYVIGDVSGDCKMTASANANVIVLGEIKPDGYVEIDIGERLSSENRRFAEVLGKQYAVNEYENKYGVITGENLLVEIVEKTQGGAISSYYFVDAENQTYVKLNLDEFMNTSERRDIRLSDNVGIRYRAEFSKAAKLEKEEYEIEEYGFVITIASELTEDYQLNFDISNYVSGVAYDNNGKDLIYDNTNDVFAVVSGVLYGIPEEQYKTLLASKPYAKINIDGNTFVVYGEQVEASLYDMAKLYENDSSLTDEQQEIVGSIIATSEKE